MTLRNGDSLTLNGIAWTIRRLSVVNGCVNGAWLERPAGPDMGGDTIAGSTEHVYMTAANLRRGLAVAEARV